MSEIEVILAALAAGVGAGTTAAAQSAVGDAYAGLRELIRRALVRQGHTEDVLQPGALPADRLSVLLLDAGVGQDAAALTAAYRLLALTDPDGVSAGRYATTSAQQAGDTTMHIGTNPGMAIGTAFGPVTATFGQPPVPPRGPGA